MNTDSSRKFKIILSAREIPFGEMVTKINGEKKYTLKERVIIYGENRQEIQSAPGIVFMVGLDGAINAIVDTTELVWHADYESFVQQFDPCD